MPPWFQFQILFVILFFLTHSTSPDQKQALIDIYSNCNGANWYLSTNWLSGDPCTNSWAGVSCDGPNNNVVTLDLSSNNLICEFPGQYLIKLTLLENLLLNDNGLSGNISLTNFSQFQSLTIFQVSHNLLQGSLPDSLCLPSISQIDISFNSISGIFHCAENSTPIFDTFIIQHNLIKAHINEFLPLNMVHNLDAQDNKLYGALDEIWWNSNFTNLNYLDLSHNPGLFMSKNPGYFGLKCFSYLAKLETLILDYIDLSNAKLDQYDWMTPAGSPLVEFSVDHTQLSGSFPPIINNAINYIRFSACCNDLSGPLPGSAINSLIQLNYFDIHLNDFDSELPQITLSTIPDHIDLSGNDFLCPIPDHPFYSTADCLCPLGQGGSKTVACSPCGKGKISLPQAYGNICVKCKENEYAPDSENSQCLNCPTLMYSSSGSGSCSALAVFLASLALIFTIGLSAFFYGKIVRKKMETKWGDRLTNVYTRRMMGADGEEENDEGIVVAESVLAQNSFSDLSTFYHNSSYSHATSDIGSYSPVAINHSNPDFHGGAYDSFPTDPIN